MYDIAINGWETASMDGLIYDGAAETAAVWAEAQGCSTDGSTAYATVSDGAWAGAVLSTPAVRPERTWSPVSGMEPAAGGAQRPMVTSCGLRSGSSSRPIRVDSFGLRAACSLCLEDALSLG